MSKETITIKMLKQAIGTQDGFTSELFRKGEVYEVCESLAKSFIKMAYAEKAGVIVAALHNPVVEKKVVSPVTSRRKGTKKDSK